MLCERCGNDISDSAVICPSCGAVTSRSPVQPSTSYGAYPDSSYTEPDSYNQPPPVQTYQQGYQQRNYMPPPLPPPPRPQQPSYGYAPPYNNPPPMYQPGPVNVTVNVSSSNNSNTALVVEIIASLFGIYGIGWLMAGETTTGVLLLVGSLVLYWPIFIIGTIITLGFGLLCLGPLAIAAIIVNAILLNKTLNRKAAQVTVVVPPPQQMRMPPQ
jgi:hypothetical protein